jgi:hypothetical protein
MAAEDKCLRLLIKFLDSNERNSWLCSKGLQVYVRKSKRLFRGRLVPVLDIASICATPPGKGVGTRFMEEANRINPYKITFVESVLNELFQGWLLRNGWKRIPGVDNYWKKP